MPVLQLCYVDRILPGKKKLSTLLCLLLRLVEEDFIIKGLRVTEDKGHPCVHGYDDKELLCTAQVCQQLLSLLAVRCIVFFFHRNIPFCCFST